jgi:DNA-binding response OmpR family regulator/HPt (histidine-containing phosphotransfer) domain-containing protein
MPALSPGHEKKLQELRAEYVARLPERVSSLLSALEEELFTSADQGARWPRLEELVQTAHRLCGSAAIFGFGAVSEAARALEDVLSALIEERGSLGAYRLAIIRKLQSLKSALRAEDLHSPEPRHSSPARPRPAPDASPLRRHGSKPCVLLVDDDPDTLELLAFHLRDAGLGVELALSGNEALEKLQQGLPDAIVADVMMGGMSGYELCRLVREMGHTEVPLLLCSALAGPKERMLGLRLGADDYVVKPFEPDELLLKLRRWVSRTSRQGVDAAVSRSPDRPKSILIVDDDIKSAQSLRPHLEERGFSVRCVGSGNEALDFIRSTPPDLVVLDVVMPIVSGFDVCRWIRDNPATHALPVIFVSARNRPKDVDAGKQAGSDLYLFKPVSARRLVNMVEMFLSKDAPLARKPRAAAPSNRA